MYDRTADHLGLLHIIAGNISEGRSDTDGIEAEMYNGER